MGVGAELGLHADNEVEEFFALNHLRGGLTTDGGLHYGFDVGDVDAIAGDFVAIPSMSRLGWPSSRTTVSSVKPGRSVENVLDFDGFFLRTFRSGPIYFDGERALEAGQGFVHGVFGGLREVEDDAGIRLRASC